MTRHRPSFGGQTVNGMCPKTTKYCINPAHAFKGLQALRVNKTRELKWFECEGTDIQISFLFEIQHGRPCELRSIALDVCIIPSLSVISCRIGTCIRFMTGRRRRAPDAM